MADFTADFPATVADLAPLLGPNDDKPATEVIIGGVSSGGAAPVIDNFSPAVGTPIGRTTPISFDVTDDNNELLRAEIYVTLAGDTFVVHDGDKFRGSFTNLSSRVPIANGFRYTVLKNGGWTTTPVVFEVHATDQSGNEAT